MKTFKQYLKEADNTNEYPSIRSEARRRLALERMAMGMPDIEYLAWPEDDTVFGPPPPEPSKEDRVQYRMQGIRQNQLMSQIEKERQAEYPEEAEQLKSDIENYNKFNKMQSSNFYQSLPFSLKAKLITAANPLIDKIHTNPTFSFAWDAELSQKYPNDFSKEQITGTEPDIRIVPSSEQEREITLNRVVPNKYNPPGMRNVTK